LRNFHPNEGAVCSGLRAWRLGGGAGGNGIILFFLSFFFFLSVSYLSFASGEEGYRGGSSAIYPARPEAEGISGSCHTLIGVNTVRLKKKHIQTGIRFAHESIRLHPISFNNEGKTLQCVMILTVWNPVQRVSNSVIAFG
jgi:hypothetical protein